MSCTEVEKRSIRIAVTIAGVRLADERAQARSWDLPPPAFPVELLAGASPGKRASNSRGLVERIPSAMRVDRGGIYGKDGRKILGLS
jgi:hypothetical protein